MSFAARLQEVQATRKPPFLAWVQTLDDEDRAALIEAAGDPRIDSRTLAQIIRDQHVRVGVETLDAWRRTNGYPG